MERKVAQIGPSTLMISLPNKWVKEKEIQKGDSLFASMIDESIIFSKSQVKAKEKEISVDISNFNKYLLSRYLEVLYLSNYSKIILTYTKQEIKSDKDDKILNIKSLISKLSNRFIGMEIVSQSKNSTELRWFLLDDDKDLATIEKRIYFLLKDTMEEFLNSLDKNTHAEYFENVYEYHDNISKFITYYLKILNQSDKNDYEKRQLFTLYLIIDKIVDKFRHTNEMVHKFGYTPKVKKIIKEIFELVYELFTALHKGDINQELVSKRYQLVKKVESSEFTLNEYKVIAEIRIVLDIINDFSRAIIVEKLSEK